MTSNNHQPTFVHKGCLLDGILNEMSPSLHQPKALYEAAVHTRDWSGVLTAGLLSRRRPMQPCCQLVSCYATRI